MACIEETDLTAQAQQHIAAQKSNIKNQRTRLSELQTELQQLKSNPSIPPLKLAETEKAIGSLQYHLNGNINRDKAEQEVEKLKQSGLKPERLQQLEKALKTTKGDLIKDPDLDTAEERAKVMEALYTQRQHLVFTDTNAKDQDGNTITREATVFGAATVKGMREIGENEIAEDLMVRAISYVNSQADSKNPNDYLVTKGMEVKSSLSDGIEHHHIYNNIYVDKDGRVVPGAVNFFYSRKTGEINLSVNPEPYNAPQHGGKVQFIELIDGGHSGNDPSTHLHFYKFNNTEADTVKQRIKDDLPTITANAKKRVSTLDNEIADLETRRIDPVGYEKSLQQKIAGQAQTIADAEALINQYPKTPSGNPSTKGLTPQQKQEIKDAQKQIRDTAYIQKQTQSQLDEHQLFMDATTKLSQMQVDYIDTQAKKKAIHLGKPATWGGMTKDEAKAEKQRLEIQEGNLKQEIRKSRKTLKSKGSIDEQIKSKTEQRDSAEKVSQLTEAEALTAFENSNGFLSFNKGKKESEEYTKSRPRMNSEINKMNARQAIEILEAEHPDPIAALQEMASRQYKRNLLMSLEGMMNKVSGTLDI
ncbi:hypothetical protein [Anabaena sp. PCC 7108]|uniref:hypothetical protein n=1 Tax=Anabaena sp. PCC 7108 TaxID=163908 RepID=UPI000349D024|nr:hypothetical protein [Anabaena sp. PCC 7108]